MTMKKRIDSTLSALRGGLIPGSTRDPFSRAYRRALYGVHVEEFFRRGDARRKMNISSVVPQTLR